MGAPAGVNVVGNKGPAGKLIAKLKQGSEAQEEDKYSVMPIFTNQKDVINQDRKQSQLRAPLTKALLIGVGQTDSSPSAKNGHSTTSSAYNSNSQSQANNSEQRDAQEGGSVSTPSQAATSAV